ncbi:MAG: thiol-disulfide isomerase/thioredoxin [Ascidiaceihabitans sp.]|jgi:thiol-disulfide isomerase/thioredoxin
MSKIEHAAHELIRRCALAYQALPSIAGHIRTFPVSPNQETEDQVSQIAFSCGTGTDAAYSMAGYGGAAVGNDVFLMQADQPRLYLKTVLDTDFLTTMRSVLGAALFAPPQIALRQKDCPYSWLSSLGLGLIHDIAPSAVHPEIDGFDVLELRGNQGTVTVKFHTETGFLSRIDLTIGDAIFAYAIDHEAVMSKNESVSFDTTDRREVASFSGFTGVPATIGAPVPDITFETIDGQTRSLAQAKGKRLVLDFWALWCRPCLNGMPHLDALAKRLTAENAPAEIWTIALVEQDDADGIKAKIRAMWQDQSYDLPILIDLNGQMSQDAFGVRSIPTTVIIDTDGVLTGVESGMTPSNLEALLLD